MNSFTNDKVTIGKEYMDKKYYKNALDYFYDLHLKYPNNTTFTYYYGKNLFFLYKYMEAKKVFKTLVKTSYKETVTFELGKIEFEIGNYDRACEYYASLFESKFGSSAKLEYGKVLLIQGDIEGARDMMLDSHNCGNKFATVELAGVEFSLGNSEIAFKYLEPCIKEKNVHAYLKIIYHYIINNDYVKAYEYFKGIFECDSYKINDKELDRIGFYLKYKLNLLSEGEKNSKNYYYRQMMNYSKDEALFHLYYHLTSNDRKYEHSLFYKDANLKDIFNFAWDNIIDIDGVKVGTVDRYFLDYGKDVGVVNGVTTSYIQVLTDAGTKNILSIYPILNYAKPKLSDKVIKKESPIEKFNRKYKISN